VKSVQSPSAPISDCAEGTRANNNSKHGKKHGGEFPMVKARVCSVHRRAPISNNISKGSDSGRVSNFNSKVWALFYS
jgi:hypothetical protein